MPFQVSLISFLRYGFGLCIFGYVVTLPGLTQTVTSDGTTATTVTNSGSFTVTGGTQHLNTLFHSFVDFSPDTWDVLFQLNGSQSTVDTIINRVTGENTSFINGQLQLTGGNSPDFFLINPHGIIFGNNASLALPGSFLASTAEAIVFEDDLSFSATAPESPPLLTVSRPVGLRMGSSSGNIYVNNTGHNLTQSSVFSPVSRISNPLSLTVPVGETLALIGRNLNLDGGILVSETGHIELSAVSQGQVNLNSINTPWQLDYGDVERFGNITLGNRSFVDVSQVDINTAGGGSITMVGHDVQLADASIVLVQNLGNQPAGDIRVQAEGTLAIVGTNPFGDILTGFKNQNMGSGESGNLEFQVDSLSVTQGAEVEAATYGVADGGDVVIEASNTIDIVGFSSDSPDSTSTISTITVGSGHAGDLNIKSRALSIRDGGNLISFNFFNPFFGGSGDAGDLQIDVSEGIEIVGDNIITQIPSGLTATTLSNGNGGSLTIMTPRLVIANGGRIGTTTFSDGNAGDLIIDVSESIHLNGVGTSEFNPSLIIASANILDPFTRNLFGLPDAPTGRSGEIVIQTPSLELTEGAQITVRNDGSGDSGDLMIEGSFVSLDQESEITASTLSGEGGNIRLSLDSALVLLNGSQLSSEASGRGNGGNITINAPVMLGIGNSDIVANAVTGSGGNISITTQGIIGLVFRNIRTVENDITASSELGVDGSVEITNFGSEITTSLVELSDTLEDKSSQITQGCGAAVHEFVVTGRGGVPQGPTDVLLPDNLWVDIRDVNTAALSNIMPPAEPVVSFPSLTQSTLTEATTWQTSDGGQIELITFNPNQTHLPDLATCLGALRSIGADG